MHWRYFLCKLINKQIISVSVLSSFCLFIMASWEIDLPEKCNGFPYHRKHHKMRNSLSKSQIQKMLGNNREYVQVVITLASECVRCTLHRIKIKTQRALVKSGGLNVAVVHCPLMILSVRPVVGERRHYGVKFSSKELRNV